MFNSKKNEQVIDPNSISINIISKGTEISGNVNSQGDMRVEGQIDGSLTSKARVVIGDSGEVKGNITAHNAVISGKVIGNVLVSELLFLKSTAKIFGDIVVGKIVVENGAEFNGTCKMTSDLVNQATKQDGARPAAQ
jgi:cytoskeletal protein CcmA (bactofilin family)